MTRCVTGKTREHHRPRRMVMPRVSKQAGAPLGEKKEGRIICSPVGWGETAGA